MQLWHFSNLDLSVFLSELKKDKISLLIYFLNGEKLFCRLLYLLESEKYNFVCFSFLKRKI
jgi:hypothetical protein